jgi:hypothetical protein
MQNTPKKNSNHFGFLAGLWLLALACGTAVAPVAAQDVDQPRSSAAATPSQATAGIKAGKRYFVEFRSRSALSYGHTFLVHGKLNAAGQVGQVTADQVAGLHPATESSIPWMIGHLVPVISETGFSDGDIEDEYITARYTVLLTEAEYQNVAGYIAKHKKNSPLWHAVLYNCNAWVGDVAKFMGKKVPESTMLYPDEYIGTLAKLNGGQPVLQATKPASTKSAHQANAAHQASATEPLPALAEQPPDR